MREGIREGVERGERGSTRERLKLVRGEGEIVRESE